MFSGRLRLSEGQGQKKKQGHQLIGSHAFLVKQLQSLVNIKTALLYDSDVITTKPL